MIIKSIDGYLTLLLTTGKTLVPFHLDYDDDDDAFDPISELSIIYDGIKYRGKGTNYLWTDTFADLQKNLPEGVSIACCLTCRHGNMCPYGNSENELYCTKGLKVENEDDLCDLFDAYLTNDPNILLKVSSFNYCDNFVYQSDDYCTYNDYLYNLSDSK